MHSARVFQYTGLTVSTGRRELATWGVGEGENVQIFWQSLPQNRTFGDYWCVIMRDRRVHGQVWERVVHGLTVEIIWVLTSLCDPSRAKVIQPAEQKRRGLRYKLRRYRVVPLQLLFKVAFSNRTLGGVCSHTWVCESVHDFFIYLHYWMWKSKIRIHCVICPWQDSLTKKKKRIKCSGYFHTCSSFPSLIFQSLWLISHW